MAVFDHEDRAIPRNANKWASKNGLYNFERKLDKGTFGTYLQAQRGKYGGRMTVLLFELPWGGAVRQNKFSKSTRLNHRNLVNVAECYECHNPPLSQMSLTQFPTTPPPTAVAVVMELCMSGSLESYLHNYRINEETRLRWYKDLALGLQYLHTENVLHWDICPSNIQIQNDKLKLANVGFTKLAWDEFSLRKLPLSYAEFLNTHIQSSVPFMAPELWKGSYNMSSEVFSLALVFFAIAEAPDDGHHKAVWAENKDTLGHLLHSKKPPRTMSPVHLLVPSVTHVRPQETNLFNEMLRYDCHSRPDINTIVSILLSMKEGGGRGNAIGTYSWLCSC